MKCPFCAHVDDKVIDSREGRGGDTIRRRRECLKCSRRFTTYERIDEIPYMVIKKDGRRERFERQKILQGLLKACEKRPVATPKLEGIVDEIEAVVHESTERELTTTEIGEMIMHRLKKLDKVAYVRFASVYMDFKDVQEFMSELKNLLKDRAVKKQQALGEKMNRRNFLKSAAVSAAAGAAMVNRGRYPLFAGGPEYSSRAVELVQRSTVIDMLAPLWISPSKTQKMLGNPENFKAEDFAPYKSSSINVFHIAIGTGGPDAYLETLQFLSGYNSLIARHDDWFERVDTPDRLDAIKSSGKVGIILGIQNSEHFRKADDVDYFYGLGQRVSQLTYNARTLIGNGSTERRDEGLSDFGVSIVERMNKLCMAVDVSHCGDKTTLDAFEVSKKPALVTHSNCRALNPNHPRCKTDEAIKAMAAKGGVMGITEVRMFVSPKEPTGVDAMLDHYDYVAKLVGVEHVGVGSDIDLLGYDAMPADEYKQLKAGYKSTYGFRDKIDLDGYNFAKRPFDLAEGLIRRKYSDANIEAILGGNFRRVLKEIWTV